MLTPCTARWLWPSAAREWRRYRWPAVACAASPRQAVLAWRASGAVISRVGEMAAVAHRRSCACTHLCLSFVDPLQRYMVSRVNNNVDMAPVGRVTLVQQLQNCMPLATGQGQRRVAVLPHAFGWVQGDAFVGRTSAGRRVGRPAAEREVWIGVRFSYTSRSLFAAADLPALPHLVPPQTSLFPLPRSRQARCTGCPSAAASPPRPPWFRRCRRRCVCVLSCMPGPAGPSCKDRGLQAL